MSTDAHLKPKSKSKSKLKISMNLQLKPKSSQIVVQKLNNIIDVIAAAGWTLEDFLCHLFSDQVEIREEEQLLAKQKIILALLSDQCLQISLQTV